MLRSLTGRQGTSKYQKLNPKSSEYVLVSSWNMLQNLDRLLVSSTEDVSAMEGISPSLQITIAQ